MFTILCVKICVSAAFTHYYPIKMGNKNCSTCGRESEKQSINEYELVIADGEKSIGWDQVNTTDLVDNIKRYSRNFTLNVNGFNLVCERAKMHKSDMTEEKVDLKS